MTLFYWLRLKMFGPEISEEDLVLLRTRADVEDWAELMHWISAIKNKRKRRWWYYYLRENLIFIQTRPDPYDDDDPWELDA